MKINYINSKIKRKEVICIIIAISILIIFGRIYFKEIENKIKYNYEVIVIEEDKTYVNDVIVEEKFAEIKK